MVQKKSAKPRTASLNKILTTMERGFAAVADDFAEVRRDGTKIKADIADIRKTMATKKDFEDIVEEKLKPISAELSSIRRDLDELKQKADNNAGLTKEIDHALERIAAIEKHLGMDKKIAA